MRSENARLSEVLFTIPVALLSEENFYRRVARAIHLDLPARDGFERTCSRDFKDAQMTRAHICTVFTLFSYGVLFPRLHQSSTHAKTGRVRLRHRPSKSLLS